MSPRSSVLFFVQDVLRRQVCSTYGHCWKGGGALTLAQLLLARPFQSRSKSRIRKRTQRLLGRVATRESVFGGMRSQLWFVASWKDRRLRVEKEADSVEVEKVRCWRWRVDGEKPGFVSWLLQHQHPIGPIPDIYPRASWAWYCTLL
jgi:hypothetical protein